MSETERPAAHIWKHVWNRCPLVVTFIFKPCGRNCFCFQLLKFRRELIFLTSLWILIRGQLCFSNSLRVFLMTSMKTQKNRSFVISGRTGSLNVSFLVTNRNTYQRSDVLQTQRCEFDDQQFSLTAQTQTEVRPHRNHIQHFFFWPYQTFSRSSSEESTRPTSSSSWSG